MLEIAKVEMSAVHISMSDQVLNQYVHVQKQLVVIADNAKTAAHPMKSESAMVNAHKSELRIVV